MAPRRRRRADRWDAHPVLAWWVRVGVLLVPLAVSVVVALLVIALLPDPDTTLEHVAWWVAVLGSAFAAAQFVDRMARRALPLAVLLQLSLVFPDRAPSRLRAARRTSLREIEHQVAALHAAGETGGPDSGAGEAARMLVSLVGALGLHDKRTRGHSERVRAYVDMLTEEMGLPEEDRARLRWAALLHDLGKLSVPGAVLNGGRDLGEDEWAALRRHPVEGERLASALLPWLGEWGRCVREHHERWDGSGYPQGLVGTQISLGARIVAVADAFEVMTANRSYQAAVGATAAREELARCAGTDFDPAVVRAFLQVGLGRLRGVLGPLSLLPVALVTGRAGDLAKGMTTVAAIGAVALAVSGGTSSGGTVSPAAPTHVAAPPTIGRPIAPLLPRPTPQPTAGPTPSVTAPLARALPHVAVVASPRAVAASSPSPEPAPAAAPAAQLAHVLYLAGGGHLAAAVPASGTVTVPQAGSALFGIPLEASATLTGAPRIVLFHAQKARHGKGHPPAVVKVILSDCDAGTCRTLSTGYALLRRTKAGYAEQSVRMRALDTVVESGHVLQVSIALVSHVNVSQLVVAYGGTTPSRLVLAEKAVGAAPLGSSACSAASTSVAVVTPTWPLSCRAPSST